MLSSNFPRSHGSPVNGYGKNASPSAPSRSPRCRATWWYDESAYGRPNGSHGKYGYASGYEYAPWYESNGHATIQSPRSRWSPGRSPRWSSRSTPTRRSRHAEQLEQLALSPEFIAADDIAISGGNAPRRPEPRRLAANDERGTDPSRLSSGNLTS